MKRNQLPYALNAMMLAILATAVSCGQSLSDKHPGLELTNGWFTLAPNIDDFSVEMPGLTKFVAPAQPNAYIFRNGRSVYTLISFPRNENESASDEEQLIQAGDTFSKRLVDFFQKKGRTLQPPTARRLDLKAVPGLEYSLSDSDDLYRLRLYLRNKRLYSLTAIVPVADTSSAERFLNSFTFDRKAPAQFLATPPPQAPLGDPKSKPQPNESLNRSQGKRVSHQA